MSARIAAGILTRTNQAISSPDLIIKRGARTLYAYVGGNPLSYVDPLGLAGYWDRVSDNFTSTNSAIPGMGFLLPTGVGLATARYTAEATGGITFLGAASFYGTSQFGGALIFASLNSVVNTGAVGGAFQFGNLLGSMVNAIPVDSSGTVRDAISDLMFNAIQPTVSQCK